MSKRIYAHRGLPTLAPENSMAGFELMKEKGVTWFETDIAITKDGKLVIIHDDYLDRTSNMSGEITSMNYEDIKNADVGVWFGSEFKGQYLPTMDQLVEFINKEKLNVNLELKGTTGANGLELADQLVEKVSTALSKIDKDIEIVISSFNPIVLNKMYQKEPNYEYAILFEHTTLYPDWPLIADFCGAKSVNVEEVGLTEAMIKDITNKGYEVNVWTVNDLDRINQLFNWGASGIFTDIADKVVR